MFNRKSVVIALICLSALGTVWLFGYEKGKESVLIAEYKVAASNLALLSEGGDPALMEFAKARYYYCANRLPDGYFPLRGDFGPVNAQLVSNTTIGKGPTTAGEEYQRFKQRIQRLQPKN
jgi:hypothetical protein